MPLQASASGLLEHPLLPDSPCSVLQYVDDTLILIKANASHLQNLQRLLHDFSSMTGLHINFEKRTFIPIAIDNGVA
jgi:hypothetical protein